MGARLYDEAIVSKIQKWIKDPNIHVLKPNETSRLLQMKADESSDHLVLPFISLSRSGYRVLNKNKQPKSFEGVTIRIYDKEGNLVNEGNAMKFNAIPIQLEYYLDIYTLDFEECDEYVRNFIFNFVNYPVSEVVIPYNDLNITHRFTIYLNEEIEDNSDIPERRFPDQFTRYTLKFTVDDAYLFSIPSKTNVSTESIQLNVRDKELEKIVETHNYDISN